MFKDKFTAPDPDPFAVEVFLRPSDPASQYLDDNFTNQLAAAAPPGTAPTPELMNLLGLAGARICERAASVEEADRELVVIILSSAIRTDAAWFEGRHEGDGFRGRLRLGMRK